MIRGPEIAREIGAAAALAPWRYHEVAPGATATTYGELCAYVSRTLDSYCRPVGTAARGAARIGPRRSPDPYAGR